MEIALFLIGLSKPLRYEHVCSDRRGDAVLRELKPRIGVGLRRVVGGGEW